MKRGGPVLAVLALVAAGIGIAGWLARGPHPNGSSGDGAPSAPAAPAEAEPAPAPRLEGRGEAPKAQGSSPSPLRKGWIEVTAAVEGADGTAAVGAGVTLRRNADVLAQAETDADGRFVLRTAAPDGVGVVHAAVHIRDVVGSVAFRYVVLHPEPPSAGSEASARRDLGRIRLRPACPFDVQVVCRGGCRPPATLRLAWPDYTAGFFLRVFETDADGRARVEGVHAGRWRLLATGEGCGRGSAFVTLPREVPGPVEIALGPARTLAVRVVDRDTSEGVAGATVEVFEVIPGRNGSVRVPYEFLGDVPPTDADGRTAIHGLAEEDALTLHAHAPAYPFPPMHLGGTSGRVQLHPGATEVEIELVAARTITWPIVAESMPVPPDGTPIAVLPRPGARHVLPTEGVVAEGRLVVAGWPEGYAIAVARTPDGETADLYAPPGETTGSEISFVLTRAITVSLRYADGEVAEGIAVVARNAGHNDLLAPVRSDEHGIARLEGLGVGRLGVIASVWVLGDDGRNGGRKIGMVDLRRGDAALEAVVGREREVVVRVRVDGVPRLPHLVWVRIGSSDIYKLERDEAGLAWRFRWRPPVMPMKARLVLNGNGFVDYGRRLDVQPGPELIEVEVDVEGAGTLVGVVTPPPDGRHHVTIERWSTEDGAWYRSGTGWRLVLAPTEADENGQIRFAPLATGRYRLRDGYSQTLSEEVEVRAGETVEAALDLSTSFRVSGRVESTSRPTPARFSVRVVGLPEQAPDGRPVGARHHAPGDFTTDCAADGSFRLRLPGPGPWTLVPEGLHLKPEAQGGSVTVEGPTEAVVLRLVGAGTTTLHFDRTIEQRHTGRTRVLLYADEPQGPPTHECRGWSTRETLTFSNYVPGTWTVWIDAKPFAPVILRGVVLRDGHHDLGRIALSYGAEIRFRVLFPEGGMYGLTSVSAMAVDEPGYSRSVNLGGSSREVVLCGLGRGRFHVAGPDLELETIEILAGDETIERVLDLR